MRWLSRLLRPGVLPSDDAYQSFWHDVGDNFPDIGGAASTRYYAENERRLFLEHFPPLSGLKLLKTDLWDEAKNTRILAWAAEQGAVPYGVDISAPIVTQAMAAFEGMTFHGVVADIRDLPFPDGTFDAIYSMGTIEHFEEPGRALAEMVRVLKTGGVAIVGVPNRHDPFLRPLLAAALQSLGLYAYGYEKSFSRRAFREMLTKAGLTVTAETAILFIPGWLRMLDLALYTRFRPASAITGLLVRPFAFLDRHLPFVRRHGYLLATVATKPATKQEGLPMTDESVRKTEQQWRETLTPEQYRVLRERGTEPAFTGLHWDNHAAGVYRCAGCGAELFSSDTKFDSGTGWPSFSSAAGPGSVTTHEDTSHGMRRIEVRCARCGGHLGHLFPDGPAPSGCRYCINSASLAFSEKKTRE